MIDRETAKDLYAEGLSVGLELGRKQGRAEGAAAEREACADLAQDHACIGRQRDAEDIAAAIRARGARHDACCNFTETGGPCNCHVAEGK